MSEGRPHRREASDGDAIVTKQSPWSISDTVARLTAVAAARDMDVIAVVDHGANARDLGLDLESKLVIFGRVSDSTRVIEAAPLAALALPLRVLVWQDGHETLVSYPAPISVARRFDLDGELAAVFADLDALITTVIDR